MNSRHVMSHGFGEGDAASTLPRRCFVGGAATFAVVPMLAAAAVFARGALGDVQAGQPALRFVPVEGVAERVEVDTSAEPKGAAEFNVDMPAGGGAVLNAAEFGVAETNADNTAAMRAALAAAKARGASRLELPKGVYRFESDSPLAIKGFADFTFDGGGSKFVSYRRKGPFMEVSGCTRLRLCDFSVDWDWGRSPLASVIEVKAADRKSVDILFRDYGDFPDKGALFLCASAYDPVTKSVGVEGMQTRGFDSISSTARQVRVEWIAPNMARVAKSNSGMEAGQLYRLQHFYYHMGGIVMSANSHVRVERVRVLSTPGHAFRISGEQHHTLFRDVDIVAPADDPRRVITCTGDHLHLTNSKGFIKLENCEFSLGADDIFNMHDNSAYAVKAGPRSVKVLNSALFGALPKGTRIELRNADYSPSGMTCSVAAAKRLGARTALIEFDEAVPGETGREFILFDRRYDTHNVIVRGCRFHDNRGRGLLILARDVTVENNVFRHHEAGAIKIETGWTLDHWSEGYGVSNVVVRNNVFDTVNPTGRPAVHRERSVYTGIYLRTDPSQAATPYPIIRDVLFANNEFRESTGVAAYLSSISNVTFRGNVFIDKVPRRQELKYRSQFFLDNARDVKLLNNTWIKSPCVAAPGVEWNPATCDGIDIRGNSLRQTDVEVDFGKVTGEMLPLHGVCNSPLRISGVQDTFRDAGIPFMRPHDACGAFGGAHYIDIPNVFPDFSRDENDPESYDFALTDAYLSTVVGAGTEVFYRLGVTFEPQTKRIKCYNTWPPKDFAKWARICEHVIRHYTEGWANGKKWNIRYWEIWNEPETTSGWMGTWDQFLDFYRIASNHLKAKFPHLRIGGYAASGFYAALGHGTVTEQRKSYLRFFEKFIAYVTAPETKSPLDFFSWHIYTTSPEEVAEQARWVRRYLDGHGLAGVETDLNEWNRIDHQDAARRPEYYEEMKAGPGPAFCAAVFCLLQRDRTVSKAMYYDAYPQRAYCGLYYFPSERPTPTWEVFRKFNALYRLGTCVEATSSIPGVYVCAATDGAKRAIMIANTGTRRTVSVSGEGDIALGENEVRLIEH